MQDERRHWSIMEYNLQHGDYELVKVDYARVGTHAHCMREVARGCDSGL